MFVAIRPGLTEPPVFVLNDVKKEVFESFCSAYFVYFHLKRSSYESL